MVLLPGINSSFGHCTCACEEYISTDQWDSHLKDMSYPYCRGIMQDGQKRILAYKKEWNSCQPLFDQVGNFGF